jgi:hypothetical protein
MRDTGEANAAPRPQWTLLTNHGLVLMYVAAYPDATVRQIAAALILTERRVSDIIRELASEQLVLVARRGRRSHYTVNAQAHFRHPLIADVSFQGFIKLLRERSALQPPVPLVYFLASAFISATAASSSL